MEKKSIWKRDFVLVVLGQIISIFGNTVLRFALPLYLLSETGSAALFGVVTAIAFIPMIILSPIGGILTDRINKRNIMVVLDFATSLLVVGFIVLKGRMDAVSLITLTMVILYGIQGAYSPAVQASVPMLLDGEILMQGNAVINLVNSFSSLIGPVVGGALYSLFGITPILFVSVFCFFASATMEIFIHIPYEKKKAEGSMFKIAYEDLKESFHYMIKEEPTIIRVCIVFSAINMILSALCIIGIPVIVTQKLGFSAEVGSRLYGYAEGAFAVGSLVGGALAGVLAPKLKAKMAPVIIFVDALTLIPMGIALFVPMKAMTSYIFVLVSCAVMMSLATMFSVQMMSCLQMIIPKELLGKIIAGAMCISMCVTPIGQAIYGILFEILSNHLHIIFFGATILTCVIAFLSNSSFKKVDQIVENRRTTLN